MCGSGDQLRAGDAIVINNDWATSQVDMCISHHGDGSFGWAWDRGVTDVAGEDLPNYPQALIGTKPWADDSGAPMFPVQRGEVEQWDVQLDVEQERSDNEWNFALEWWLTQRAPPGAGDSITHEVMLVLERSDDHTKGGSVVEEAVTDAYGTTFDYWESLPEGPSHDSSWGFHIFKTTDNEIPSHIDLTAIQAYLYEDPDGELNDPGIDDENLWISGVEIGNENWDETTGNTRVNEFNVRLNGQTATAGVSRQFSEPEIPEVSAPTGLSVTVASSSSVDLAWDAVDDATGYAVYVDGALETEVSETGATLEGLEADTSYEVGVVALGPDGSESEATTVTATTAEDDAGECSADEITVGETCATDENGDGFYRDVDGSGTTGSNDVVTFFEHLESETVQGNPSAFDFNDSGGVGFDDVVALFGQV